jgi:AraC-like DNA-binding protein
MVFCRSAWHRYGRCLLPFRRGAVASGGGGVGVARRAGPPRPVTGGRAACELAERVSCRADDDGRAFELENAVRLMAAGAGDLDVVALEVAGRLRTVRTASARALARATHLSERQLHRRCTAAFGYGPEFLLRIHRIQRFLQLARNESRSPRLADLAIDTGYADQPHLTREVRSIMGTTPAQLLAAGRPRR